MTYVGEACLRFENAEAAIDLAFDSLKPHFQRRSRQGTDYALEFESARALIRPEPGVLWLRVESDDIGICDGTKVLIESEISRYAKGMLAHILWIAGTREPFATIFAREKSANTGAS